MTDNDKRYVVTGAAAYFKVVNPVDGKEYLTLLYRDAPVPVGADEATIQHHLDSGLIAPVEVEVTEPEVPPNPGQGDNPPVEPNRGASREAWVEYAVAKGATDADVADLKRDDLVAKYGSPVLV